MYKWQTETVEREIIALKNRKALLSLAEGLSNLVFKKMRKELSYSLKKELDLSVYEEAEILIEIYRGEIIRNSCIRLKSRGEKHE